MIMPTGLTLTTSKNARSALSRRPLLRPRSPPRNLMTTPNSGGQNIRFGAVYLYFFRKLI